MCVRGAGGSLPRPAANMTSDEKQRAMQQYQQSVEQMRGKSHRIPGEDKQHIRAKRFFSFPAVLPGNLLLPVLLCIRQKFFFCFLLS